MITQYIKNEQYCLFIYLEAQHISIEDFTTKTEIGFQAVKVSLVPKYM